jgi:hypothetical protein
MKIDLNESLLDSLDIKPYVRVRIFNILRMQGIETYKDLLSSDISQLLEVDGFGAKSFIELQKALSKKGLYLEFIDKENKELLDEYFRINKEINKKLKTYKKILSDCYNSIVFEIEHIYKKESLFLTNEENFKLQEERTIFLKKLLSMIIDILEDKNYD